MSRGGRSGVGLASAGAQGRGEDQLLLTRLASPGFFNPSPRLLQAQGPSLPTFLRLACWQPSLRLRAAAHRKLYSLAMAPSVPLKRSPFVLHASTIARAHTYLALSAFLGALLIGSALHYKKIVKNGVAGYPEEWFPSVSAT